ITKAQGVGTIRNGDDKRSLGISDASVLEGNSGTVDAVFTVILAGASSQPITVTFATANGTAIAPSDYVAASGTLTFAVGESSKNIMVKVNGDTLNEPDETFFVNLSNAANASITKAQGVGTIRNDDLNAAPTVAITSPANGATFGAPATVLITADANDSDGTVTKVEFYSGATKLGEDTTAPYNFNWV